jgi:hypothetical protein
MVLMNRIGATILGAIDYWRHPEMRGSWGGPFNGQRARAAIFLSLIAKIKPRVLIETGTYRGTTTEFMARTGLPIFTVESQARNYGFSRARFFRRRQVSVRRGDSRQALREWIDGPLRDLGRDTVFVYLDAHCDADLPLAEELDLVFNHWPAAVVMIDDFEVPFDTGYGHDRYKTGESLNQHYIGREISKHDLQTFYPSAPAEQETGRRRGCVVLVKKTVHAAALASIPELRGFD